MIYSDLERFMLPAPVEKSQANEGKTKKKTRATIFFADFGLFFVAPLGIPSGLWSFARVKI